MTNFWCRKVLTEDYQANLRLKYSKKGLSNNFYNHLELPELIIAFEFKDLCSDRYISDIIYKHVNTRSAQIIAILHL